MDFAPAKRPRAPAENIVPMINVVFLLLIFFLMSAQIAPAPPAEISPPVSRADAPPEARDVLYLDAEGTLYFNDLTGEAAVGAVATQGLERVQVRADRNAEVTRMAEVSERLRAIGIGQIDLVTGSR